MLPGNISKTLDKKKMHTEVIPTTQDFNETALYHFYKVMMNKHSKSLYFYSLLCKSRVYSIIATLYQMRRLEVSRGYTSSVCTSKGDSVSADSSG